MLKFLFADRELPVFFYRDKNSLSYSTMSSGEPSLKASRMLVTFVWAAGVCWPTIGRGLKVNLAFLGGVASASWPVGAGPTFCGWAPGSSRAAALILAAFSEDGVSGTCTKSPTHVHWLVKSSTSFFLENSISLCGLVFWGQVTL